MPSSVSLAVADIYPAMARKHGLILAPIFFTGRAGDPSLNQPDGIHPTAGGYRGITEGVRLFAKESDQQEQKALVEAAGARPQDYP